MSKNKDIQKWAEEPELPIGQLGDVDQNELLMIRQNRSIDKALSATFHELKNVQDLQLEDRFDQVRFENLLQSNLSQLSREESLKKQAEKYVTSANSTATGILGYLFGENRNVAWTALGAVFITMTAVFYFTGGIDSKKTTVEMARNAESDTDPTEKGASEQLNESKQTQATASAPESSEAKESKEEPVFASKGPAPSFEEEPKTEEEIAVVIQDPEASSRAMNPDTQSEESNPYSNNALDVSKEANLKMAVLRAKTDSEKKAALIALRDYYKAANRTSDFNRVQKRIDLLQQ